MCWLNISLYFPSHMSQDIQLHVHFCYGISQGNTFYRDRTGKEWEAMMHTIQGATQIYEDTFISASIPLVEGKNEKNSSLQYLPFQQRFQLLLSEFVPLSAFVSDCDESLSLSCRIRIEHHPMESNAPLYKHWWLLWNHPLAWPQPDNPIGSEGLHKKLWHESKKRVSPLVNWSI